MSKKQSKKQPDSSIPKQAASLVLLALEHPEETKVAVKAINTAGLVASALTTAVLDYLIPPKTAAAAPKPQLNTVAELQEPQQLEPQPPSPSPLGWPPSVFDRPPSMFDSPWSSRRNRVVWANGNFIPMP